MPSPRPYRSEADLAAMRAVLSAGRCSDHGAFYIHPGDLNWWWYYHDPRGIFPTSTFLWEKDAETIGWVIAAGGNVDVYFLPELHGTPEVAAMLAWGERRMVETAGPEEQEIMFNGIHERDTFSADLLLRSGYKPKERRLIHHSMALGVLPASNPPAGYTIRGMAGEGEAVARAAASRAAFNTQKPWEPYLENYIRFTRSPVYDPELDIVAVNGNGEVGAFAICWLDPISRTGLFEPVGTHPDHQRRGLGRAVLAEGLRRMAARGMRRAEVCAYSDNAAALALYRSVGFERDGDLLTYFSPVRAL